MRAGHQGFVDVNDTAAKPHALVYCANARLPSEKANSLQSVHFCEALARRRPTTFWYPQRLHASRGGASPAEILRFYEVRGSLQLLPTPTIDLGRLRPIWPRGAFYLQVLSFSMACILRARRLSYRPVIFTRNPFDVLLAPMWRALGRPRLLVFEDHDAVVRPDRSTWWPLRRWLDGIVCTTRAQADDLRASDFPPGRVLFAPNAARSSGARETARLRLVDGPGTFKLLYAGNLQPHKGVHTLIRAMVHLPPDVHLFILGGSPEYHPNLCVRIQEAGVSDRVTVLGWVSPMQVPSYLAAADALLLPNSGQHDLSSRYTSPLKLFEYLQSGKPIIASDVPAVSGLVGHEHGVWLVPPDDPQAVARAVQVLKADAALRDRLASGALNQAQRFTWEARAERVLEFLDRLSRPSEAWSPRA